MEHFEHKPVQTIEIIENVPDNIVSAVASTLAKYTGIKILTQSYSGEVYRCTLGMQDNTDISEQDFEKIVNNISNVLNPDDKQSLFYIQRRSFPANNITIEEIPPSEKTDFDNNEHNA